MRVLAIALVACGILAASDVPAPRAFTVVTLPAGMLDSMSAIWSANNLHWNELEDVNTLTQMLGTGKPTQHEYLGCLWGEVARDTLWLRGWVAAENLKQLQFAVTGTCDHVTRFVGTWHTHPYRADLTGHPIKERELSPIDLTTFAAAPDLVTMVMWDADSLDVAAKVADGSLRHPAPLAVH